MEDREDFTKSYIHYNPEPKTNPPKARTMERKSGTKKVFKSFAEVKEYLSEHKTEQQ